MKRWLISENGNFYKACLHLHTTLSDGSFTPEEVKKMYVDHGYSIIALKIYRSSGDTQESGSGRRTYVTKISIYAMRNE